MYHININTLWIQDVQEKEGVEYHKVLGTENPADLMTKYLTREVADKHTNALGQEVREGRAQKGLEMQGAQGGAGGVGDNGVKVAAVSRSRPPTYSIS